MPFRDYAWICSKLSENRGTEGDFGGKLTHALTQVICDRYIDASISGILPGKDDNRKNNS